jgi:hypothetical protein
VIDARGNCDLRITILDLRFKKTGYRFVVSFLAKVVGGQQFYRVKLPSFLRSKKSLGGKSFSKYLMAKLKLDLHEICKSGKLIEKELNRIIDEATEKRIALVEIIPGKGSGQLKKTVLRFLERPDIKKRYHRINKDSKNFGRVFVHFKH